MSYVSVRSETHLTTFLALHLFPGISEFSDGAPMLFKYRWFCVGWAYTWHICIRLSIFLVAVLSISRTYSMVYPFKKVKKFMVLVPSFIYLGLLLGQQLVPILAGKSFWYARRLSHCTWLLTDVVEDLFSYRFRLLHFIFVTLEYVVPAIPIISSAVISIVILQKRRDKTLTGTQKGSLEPGVRRKDLKVEATKTILYLTLAYILYNLPLVIFCILESVTLWTNLRFQINNFISHRVINFIYTLMGVHMVALNSVTNVLIYFFRKKGLRSFWYSVLTGTVESGGNSHADNWRVSTARRFYSPRLTKRNIGCTIISSIALHDVTQTGNL